ncbi:MAG TPA: metallophosphoesterase [Polyangiaceae bacterium]|nr:metallophosphoesterase [Polyangiaceae bacterium]
MVHGQRSAALHGVLGQLLWVVTAGGAWALLVIERILNLHEGPARTALIVVGLALVTGSASFAARRLRHSRLRFLPWLLLAAIATREWHRHVLREQYRASPALRSVGPSPSLWRPLTTTDVAIRYHALRSKLLLSERLRLVVLTDQHMTGALPLEYHEHVLDLVAAQDPDLILLLGDFVSDPENIEFMARVFARPWPARLGTYAVLGNHDFWTEPERIRRVLSLGNVSLLEGTCRQLPSKLGRVAICGTDAPWGPELSTELDRTRLNLVLSHMPDNVYRLGELGASVVFSGHTHGGQIRVPWIGALVVPSRFGRIFDQGHFNVEGVDLFVSAGIGAGRPPFRIYCPPEILVVDILRE